VRNVGSFLQCRVLTGYSVQLLSEVSGTQILSNKVDQKKWYKCIVLARLQAGLKE
jgi:hypothetical protein